MINNRLLIGMFCAIASLFAAILITISEEITIPGFLIIAWAGGQCYALLFIWAGSVTARLHLAQLEKIERDEQLRAEQFFDLLGDFVGDDDLEVLKQKWVSDDK
jgi:hypothetical protein